VTISRRAAPANTSDQLAAPMGASKTKVLINEPEPGEFPPALRSRVWPRDARAMIGLESGTEGLNSDPRKPAMREGMEWCPGAEHLQLGISET
jgi:hypothetical protein